MKDIGLITLYGFIVGMVGTGIGGLASLFIKETNRILSFLLGLTGGFMLFIVTFHLLPEAFILGGIPFSLLGIILGIGLIIFIEINIDSILKNPLMKSSLLLGISIAVHNFPEGLALGSSFLTMSDLGPVLSIAMLLHNIPEGLSMAIPLKVNKTSPGRILLYSILTGVPTGIGAFIGAYIGMISNIFISICLSFAGGTMLYIICDEIIPNAKALHKGRASSIGIVLGFIIGMILYF
ncbi:ZIP family metal transporter [Clostridium sp. Cult3]|uniref:ZIP family metal transporter n=1 Tax=Clostridium sp. Cult3 TaxID=2079004 RepID=UPI001F212F28|nr:ZIP family metal transporter [Clostridium sp. Cult3]MCF6460801.1 ZIP family metal transporter [Clostridium sp. Cult3]